MLYTWNLYNTVNQLYLKKKQRKHSPIGTYLKSPHIESSELLASIFSNFHELYFYMPYNLLADLFHISQIYYVCTSWVFTHPILMFLSVL